MSATANPIPYVPGPIAGAGMTGSINVGSALPTVQDTVSGWFQPMTIGVVSAIPQSDGKVKNSVKAFNTAGIIIPGDDEKLVVLKEGERSWVSSTLYTQKAFNVPTDTILIVAGMQFRVMKQKDYSSYGYVRYSLLQDFTNAQQP